MAAGHTTVFTLQCVPQAYVETRMASPGSMTTRSSRRVHLSRAVSRAECMRCGLVVHACACCVRVCALGRVCLCACVRSCARTFGCARGVVLTDLCGRSFCIWYILLCCMVCGACRVHSLRMSRCRMSACLFSLPGPSPRGHCGNRHAFHVDHQPLFRPPAVRVQRPRPP
jgi:hypothetical protein